MALPPSGPLSLSQIQTEFGGSNPISLSEYYRNGGLVTPNNTGVPTSGTISISNFYNAFKQFAFTISSNLSTPQNLRTLALAAGWNGSDPVLATNTAIISSNTTGSPALTISGSFPGGVTFVNNGTVVGMGGAGGNGGGDGPAPGNGGAGGTALSVSVAASINNGSGTIAGGGGGGGGGSAGGSGGVLGGGGGGGGGRTGLTNSAAGAGGSAREPGGAGSAGTYSSAGGGGSRARSQGGDGGAGGGWGSAGSNGVLGTDPVWQTFGTGGAAGSSVTGNSNITWIATGTRLGPIS